MANERTYLAWLRTAGAVMVLGLAIAKFDAVSAYTIGAGTVLVAAGVSGVVYGTRRYRRINRELERGRYVTGSRGHGPVLASVVLVASVLVALLLLIVDGLTHG